MLKNKTIEIEEYWFYMDLQYENFGTYVFIGVLIDDIHPTNQSNFRESFSGNKKYMTGKEIYG